MRLEHYDYLLGKVTETLVRSETELAEALGRISELEAELAEASKPKQRGPKSTGP